MTGPRVLWRGYAPVPRDQNCQSGSEYRLVWNGKRGNWCEVVIERLFGRDTMNQETWLPVSGDMSRQQFDPVTQQLLNALTDKVIKFCEAEGTEFPA